MAHLEVGPRHTFQDAHIPRNFRIYPSWIQLRPGDATKLDIVLGIVVVDYINWPPPLSVQNLANNLVCYYFLSHLHLPPSSIGQGTALYPSNDATVSIYLSKINEAASVRFVANSLLAHLFL